jgi:hypothetical protein
MPGLREDAFCPALLSQLSALCRLGWVRRRQSPGNGTQALRCSPEPNRKALAGNGAPVSEPLPIGENWFAYAIGQCLPDLKTELLSETRGGGSPPPDC